MLFVNLAWIQQVLQGTMDVFNGSTGLQHGYDCAQNFTIELLSIDPLAIYINNFVKDVEIEHLLEQSKNEFRQSLVYNERLKSIVDRKHRTSQSAMVSKDDPVSLCLSTRLKSILGNIQHIETESLQIVKYGLGEQFRIHMDWFDRPRNLSYSTRFPARSHNRLMSTFVYLSDECEGGETYFPELPGVSSVANGKKFSRTDTGEGLLVRPRRGNAVVWNNLRSDGTGDQRVAHAGLPVRSGTKIGMNLFSHYYYDAPFLGGDEE